MHIWKSRATARWLAKHEAELEKAAAQNLVVVERPGRRYCEIEAVLHSRVAAQNLQKRFGGSVGKLPRDWQKIYAQPEGHAPIRIGRRLLIVSQQQPDVDRERQLVIPAAGAFGTGEHATTAMSLRLLEEVTRRFSLGWKLLDAGTGTGILALAARRLGAQSATGLDNDPRSIAHARENARRNQISRVKFLGADIRGWKPPERFELITANLFSELLISALPVFRCCLTKSGRLIFSGILREQAGDVIDSLGKNDFVLLKKRRRGKWIALLAAHKSQVTRTAPGASRAKARRRLTSGHAPPHSRRQ